MPIFVAAELEFRISNIFEQNVTWVPFAFQGGEITKIK